jgi:endonuclease V-like protein UPF0215 family
MKTKMEEAIKAVVELKEVMADKLSQAKERGDNLEARELRAVIAGIEFAEGTLIIRNEPLTQTAGETI